MFDIRYDSAQHDELDSVFIQTVGCAIVPLVARAAGLPLLQHSTKGQSARHGLRYDYDLSMCSKAEAEEEEEEEVEDLFRLVAAAKERFKVDAIVSGAIESNYQRLRVEAVASALELISIAPLWRQDQFQLLDKMGSAGLSAILIKVAAAGLRSTVLGKTLLDTTDDLLSAYSKYGIHILGEGGEFETLAIDAPWLHCGRLHIPSEKVERQVSQDDKFATAGMLQISRVEYERKATANSESEHEIIDATCFVPSRPRPPPQTSLPHDASSSRASAIVSFKSSVSSVVTARASLSSGSGRAADAVLSCFNSIRAEIRHLHHILFVVLYLPSMRHFGDANQGYKMVKDLLAAQDEVALEVVAVPLSDGWARHGLHVQSISHWAPACIGPYAQATLIDLESGRQGQPRGLAFVAGQIGLVPASMSRPDAIVAEAQAVIDSTRAVCSTVGCTITQVLMYATSLEAASIGLRKFNDWPEYTAQAWPTAVLLVGGLPKECRLELKPLGVTMQSGARDIRTGFVCGTDWPSSVDELEAELESWQATWSDILSIRCYSCAQGLDSAVEIPGHGHINVAQVDEIYIREGAGTPELASDAQGLEKKSVMIEYVAIKVSDTESDSD